MKFIFHKDIFEDLGWYFIQFIAEELLFESSTVINDFLFLYFSVSNVGTITPIDQHKVDRLFYLIPTLKYLLHINF